MNLHETKLGISIGSKNNHTYTHPLHKGHILKEDNFKTEGNNKIITTVFVEHPLAKSLGLLSMELYVKHLKTCIQGTFKIFLSALLSLVWSKHNISFSPLMYLVMVVNNVQVHNVQLKSVKCTILKGPIYFLSNEDNHSCSSFLLIRPCKILAPYSGH